MRRRLLRSTLPAAVLVLAATVPAPAQSALERPPGLDGAWVSEAGVAHFHVIHRFWVTDPPVSKVINTPTFLVAAGFGRGVMAGGRYASNSSLVPGEVNEWEAFGRWAPLRQGEPGAADVADVAVSVAWNGVAESADGELAVARGVGPVRLHAAARAFSRFAGGDGDAALGGGAVWRVHRNVALAGDVMTLVSGDTTTAWSFGLQLRIPTTPHTVSLHATNAAVATLQSSSFGGGQRLYGFEFTVPVTLSRYFGGGDRPEAAPPGPEAADTAIVEMDNRLRFIPDTLRVAAGTAVRWDNTSDIVHTVTADPARAALESSVSLPAGARTFDSGDLLPGDAFVRVFEVPGTYEYFCVPHERAGMIGVLIVEGAGDD